MAKLSSTNCHPSKHFLFIRSIATASASSDSRYIAQNNVYLSNILIATATNYEDYRLPSERILFQEAVAYAGGRVSFTAGWPGSLVVRRR